MINFNFFIGLSTYMTKTLCSKSGKTPFPNKYWEINIYRYPVLGSLELSLKNKTDHAGFSFGFGILGYAIEFMIYDNRHWDYENDRWEVYE